MGITVLIPCFKRSEFLNTVLKSIRKQTCYHEIEKIVVSENSDDLLSEKICKQHSDMNIIFIRQPNTLSMVDHWHWLFKQPTSEFTAMLHDDDWWYPTHLECALDALKAQDVAAYFSNFIFTQNEIMKRSYLHFPSIISYMKGVCLANEYISLNFSDVAALCYLYTPFHTSGMVLRTKALSYANDNALKNANVWYADRILYPYVATIGKVVFNPQILVGVRQHNDQVSAAIKDNKRSLAHREGSSIIQKLALNKGFDILKNWEQINSNLTDVDWQEVQSTYKSNFGKRPDAVFSPKKQMESQKSAFERVVKKVVKNLLPYGIVTRYSYFIK